MQRITFALVLLAVFAFAEESPKPKKLAPDYSAAAGPRTVFVVKQFAVKDLQCRATFPVGKDKVPVVVFSHGLYGNKDAYEPLTRFYASHGYAVFQINHPDSRVFGLKMPKRAIEVAWSARPKQIKLLLSQFATIEKAVPALKGRLDSEKVAVAGHSFGAHTSQLIGGLTTGGISFRDARVKCVVCISPQGESENLPKSAWKTFTTPALFITGSKDASPIQKGKGGKWRRGAYVNAPAGDKYLVWIDGAAHGFGGINGGRSWKGSGPKNEDHVRIVKKTSLAFLDALLKGSKPAKNYLKKNGPVRAGTSTKVTFEQK